MAYQAQNSAGLSPNLSNMITGLNLAALNTPKEGRILAIDYGQKRTGLAVTDPLQIIATPLEVIETKELFNYLKKYLSTEKVVSIVLGFPQRENGEDGHNTAAVRQVGQKLSSEFASVPLHYADERYTTKIAQQAAIAGGMKKKDRAAKGSMDSISATLILQGFMASIGRY